ncbi:MAG: DUF92 domain-containing protein [Balneolales bacterium]
MILFYVLFANSGEQERIFLAFVLALFIILIALLMNWLSLDGAFAAFFVGIMTFGFGGLPAAIILVLFFSSSYLIGFILSNQNADEYARKERRDGYQVWANAFWFVFFITLGFYFRHDLMYIAAAGSLAVAMSDTWATEVGTRAFNVKTYFLLSFTKVKAGTDGGVSLKGTLGGLLGAFLLSVIFVLMNRNSLAVFVIIGLAGFLGCLLDSYLGALFQTKKKQLKLPKPLSRPVILDNNSVNAVATGFGAFFTLIMLWLV